MASARNPLCKFLLSLALVGMVVIDCLLLLHVERYIVSMLGVIEIFISCGVWFGMGYLSVQRIRAARDRATAATDDDVAAAAATAEARVTHVEIHQHVYCFSITLTSLIDTLRVILRWHGVHGLGFRLCPLTFTLALAFSFVIQLLSE